MSKKLLSEILSEGFGLLTENEIKYMKSLCKKQPHLSTIMNIGIGPGTSLAVFQESLPDAKLYGIDVKETEYPGDPFNRIVGNSKEIGVDWDEDLDILFIDGDHYEPEDDFVFWPVHVKEKGIIFVHNYLDITWPWVTFYAEKHLRPHWERLGVVDRLAAFARR